MSSRIIKILFNSAVGLYISLVCFNNIFSYSANFQFVSVIATMGDTFSKETNGWRSVNNVGLHHFLYISIITWELIIATLLWLGVFKMLKAYRTNAESFVKAKQFGAWGLSLGVLLWFTVFIAVGGEWFLMWQSKTWNALPTAFFLTICFLLFLIFHNQDETPVPLKGRLSLDRKS
ncbi:DUF2165 domain-containing protein [soil metagenome]